MLWYLEFAVNILICAVACALEREGQEGWGIGWGWRSTGECGRTASFLVNYHVGSHAFGSENMSGRNRIISFDFAEEY